MSHQDEAQRLMSKEALTAALSREFPNQMNQDDRGKTVFGSGNQGNNDNNSNNSPNNNVRLPNRLTRLSALGSPFSSGDEELKRLGRFLTRGSMVGFAIWFLLIGLMVLICPAESYGPLDGVERTGTVMVFSLLFVTNGSRLIPLMFRDSTSKTFNAGAMIGSFSVQGIALLSMAIMITCDTPIMMDTITNRKVYMMRWAEWVPLSFLMTFLTEAIDMPNNSAGAFELAWGHGISIAVSTLAGFLFPFCKDIYTWVIVFCVSCILFTSIYIRLYQRMQRFAKTNRGNSVDEKEHYERVRLSLRLLQVCGVWWTGLVVAFTACCFADRYAPKDSWWADEGLPSIVECVFEIGSKVWYLSLILDVHESIFDEGSRAVRRLEEMRDMMSVVWESSSDVIAVCVQGNTFVNAVVSPTFLTLHGQNKARLKLTSGSTALVMEVLPNTITSSSNQDPIHRVYAVNMMSPISRNDVRSNHFILDKIINTEENSMDQRNIASLARLLAKAFATPHKRETVMIHELFGMGPKGMEYIRQCEAKLTKLANDAIVIVLRDISERFQRFETEKQLIMEVTERKKDAQANRFTRHEVKNGLLAAICVLDTLKESSVDALELEKAVRLHRSFAASGMQDSETVRSNTNVGDLAMHVVELDQTLHEVLDTIMAEAMARDVIHGDYHPRLERIDIVQVLHSWKQAGSASNKSVNSRFPVMCSPSPFPELIMDPQLLRHIHRNAVSNAVKYGMEHGPVTTELYYDYINKLFLMNVINLPGPGHEELALMDQRETMKVFQPSTRLHQHKTSSRNNNNNNNSNNTSMMSTNTALNASPASNKEDSVSSGDGAWIMQKCASILGGECSIRFEPMRTVFSLKLPADAHHSKAIPSTVMETKRFRLPDNTWGIAIDDSSIQRKLLSRFLALAGIRSNRRRILGGKIEEIVGFAHYLGQLMRDHPNDKFLAIVDENLEILEGGAHKKIISGSLCIKQLRDSLSPDDEARLLALIRSANDSAADVLVYQERAHGFLAKAPIQKDKVLELLEPLWNERFPSDSLDRLLETAEEDFFDDHLTVSSEELMGTLDVLDSLLCLNEGETIASKWPSIRERLHALRGDLKTLNSGEAANNVLRAMEKLRGERVPDDLERHWQEIREMLVPIFKGMI